MSDKLFIKSKIVIVIILLFSTTFIPLISGQDVNIISYKKPLKNTFFGTNDAYDFLIICPRYFARLVKPLVRHKEKHGINTYLATLKEIYSYENIQPGRDKPEKIKLFIKDAIENWGIKYVLLVGGKISQTKRWHLPVRYIHLGNNWESEIISDLYFADIYDSEGKFNSWDSDEDGRFGEWYYGEQPEDKFIDLYPDISIGRLPCQNRFEVRLIVHKIIRYENKYQKEKPWFNNMIVAAGDTYPEKDNPAWVGNEGEFYGDMAIENMTGFNPIKLYTSDGSLTHWKDILKPMNNGCGFIYFVGHGCPMLWTNNLPNGTGGRVKPFGSSQIALLRNRNKLPICVVSGCHNLQFDVTIFNYFNKTKRARAEYIPECWGWQMTRKISGGSIATIGCTALGHTKEDKPISFVGGINELEVEFFKQYGQNKIEIIGDTWAGAIKWYIDTYPVNWNSELTNESWVDEQVVSTWILFGDPTLKIGGYL